MDPPVIRTRPSDRRVAVADWREAVIVPVAVKTPVLGSYKASIDRLLAENQKLPRKQRYTSHKIYEALCAEGYTGSEPSVQSTGPAPVQPPIASACTSEVPGGSVSTIARSCA